MPKITIPRLAIPALKIPRGLLLDIDILGTHIRIPPSDIELWPEIQLLPEITVFDPEWITRGVVESMTPTIIQAVFNAVEPYLDGLAIDFYARRGKE